MSIKRYDGSWVDIGTAKRWNGSAWQDCQAAKRWDGANWVDVWAVEEWIFKEGVGAIIPLEIAKISGSYHFSSTTEKTNAWVAFGGGYGRNTNGWFHTTNEMDLSKHSNMVIDCYCDMQYEEDDSDGEGTHSVSYPLTGTQSDSKTGFIDICDNYSNPAPLKRIQMNELRQRQTFILSLANHNSITRPAIRIYTGDQRYTENHHHIQIYNWYLK